VVSFRKRDSDAARQPEFAPVLPRDQLLSVQRPPYLVYVHVNDAQTATGEVVLVGLGNGQVRETLAELRDSGFQDYLPLERHRAMAGRCGGFRGAGGAGLACSALKDLARRICRCSGSEQGWGRRWPLASSDR
jgi:hypothetical protein